MNDEVQYMERSGDYTMFAVVIIVFLVVFCIYLVKTIIPFVDRCRYIKMEMNRSEGGEYLYWKKKLKRHYIRNIPFVGKLILKLRRRYKEKKRKANNSK